MIARHVKLAVVCTALAAAPLSAQAAGGFMKACKEDQAKFCAGVERGGGRIFKCLQSHAANELSPACSDALKKQKAR
jgi:hypothetical protein